MESIPRYLHFQRLRTIAIRHFPAGKNLSKEPRWRLLLIGEYLREDHCSFRNGAKLAEGKEIEIVKWR
jgi:hypothetical protein